jgi:hypothetical protein
VGALSQPEVGQYLNLHFVSAFQKVATFQINGEQKQGGNVAAYFCTPEGDVLHAVAGPVNADVFLREARWANETYQLALLHGQTTAQLRAVFYGAHLERLKGEHGVVIGNTGPLDRRSLARLTARQRLNNQGKVHRLLAVNPLPPVGEIYQVVFEEILNERISTSPVGRGD